MPCDKNGLIASSKGILAALGIAKNGPIIRSKNIEKISANLGEILFARLWSPFDFATAAIPKIGNKTAVKQKATIAIEVWFPARLPKNGGNIKFPAPKNIEKSVSPTTKKLLNDISFIQKTFILLLIII